MIDKVRNLTAYDDMTAELGAAAQAPWAPYFNRSDIRIRHTNGIERKRQAFCAMAGVVGSRPVDSYQLLGAHGN